MLNLKNEFIFAPVKTGYSSDLGLVTKKQLHFYSKRSPFLGAVIPEPFYLDKNIRELPTQMGIDNDDKNKGLSELTSMIHENNTKVIAHLNHPGRMANPNLPNNYYISSTDKACEVMGAVPKKMELNDFKDVIKLYVNAAIRAEKTGFDIIELQFGHGYLLAQFISPKVNDRTDEFGGSFENRIKFPLQVLDAVKLAVKLPIIARISADEMLPDGIKLNEMIEFAKILKIKGIDTIHVSAGTICNTAPWYYQHMFTQKGHTWEFAQKIKTEVQIPTIFLGQINTTEDINHIKTNYNADYLAIGRALIADPEIIGKYLGKIKENIRPCLACSEGCLGGVKSGKGLQCLVNPEVGTEIELIKHKTIDKKIAIIGAGLAGLEIATLLSKKGYQITVYEKKSIGGQFELAYLPPKKESLKKLIDFYKEEIKFYQIPIIYKEFEESDIELFDEIIYATGSTPIIPPIKGLKNYYWAEILEDKNLPTRKNIVIIGGGLIGTEIAHKLMKENNQVNIFEILPQIANGMEMIEQKITLQNLQNEKVKIFTQSKIIEINNHTIHFELNQKICKLEGVDLIIVATGMKANVPNLKNKFNKPIYIIGDAAKVSKAQHAIFSAYELANKI